MKQGCLILFLLYSQIILFAQQSWIQRQSFNQPARIQAVGFAIGGKGYIATGASRVTGQPLRDMQEFDPATNTWSYKSDLPEALRAGVAFTIGTKAYITTGAYSQGLNHTLFVWDQFSNTWSTQSPFPAGQGRMAAFGATVGNSGFVFGGFDASERALNDLWEFQESTNTWIRKKDNPGPGRCYAAGFVIGNKVYIGTGNNGTTYLRDFWAYDSFTDNWNRIPDFPGVPRTGAVAFTSGGRGYITGGIDKAANLLRDCWEFDPMVNAWIEVSSFPGIPRSYGVSFAIHHAGYLAAGATRTGYLNELWEGYPSVMTTAIPKDDPLLSPVKISPNPFFYRFFVMIRAPFTGSLELTITDSYDRVVFRKSFQKDVEYIVRCYEIDDLPEGLFLFTVKDPTGQFNYKQTVIHKSFWTLTLLTSL